MATPKQVSFLKKLSAEAREAGGQGLKEDSELSELSYAEVQRLITELREQIPATPKQLEIIFEALGGRDNVPPEQALKVEMLRRDRAHSIVNRLFTDVQTKQEYADMRAAFAKHMRQQKEQERRDNRPMAF